MLVYFVSAAGCHCFDHINSVVGKFTSEGPKRQFAGKAYFINLIVSSVKDILIVSIF